MHNRYGKGCEENPREVYTRGNKDSGRKHEEEKLERGKRRERLTRTGKCGTLKETTGEIWRWKSERSGERDEKD